MKGFWFHGGLLALNRYKDDQRLARASARHRTFEESGVHTIVFPSATERESGKYTCSAINEYGRIHASSYVRIIHPSSIPRGKPAMFLSRPDKVLSLVEGEDIVVSFRVTGDPKPRVTWMKGLKDISNSYRSLKETSDDYVRLTLKRVTEEDVGTYCIMAKNIHGCDRAFFTVRLRYRARSATPTGEGTTYRRLTYQEKYGYRGKSFFIFTQKYLGHSKRPCTYYTLQKIAARAKSISSLSYNTNYI